ncbi:MAG TPA: hypothetical protein VK776_13410 [Bryobacteraceae bacterium]|jgi:hypothetical protein|nr:hypothetical protein [Bryobacteraceae bacterium]
MASGIEFNEDYLDPKADIHRVIFDLIRDYARFGLMAMNYGKLGDARVVNDAWMHESTTAPAFNPATALAP